MKLIDDLKAAAKACLEDGSGGNEHYHFENVATPKVVLLLCEAVEALQALKDATLCDYGTRQQDAVDRASAVLDKLRSYAT